MLKEMKCSTAKIDRNYVAEIDVLDEENGKHYYVVAQLGDLLYATFDGSYIAYKKGKSTIKPVQLEGETNWWFAENNTRFFDFYNKACNLASQKQHEAYVARKYAHLKKPLNNIRFETVYRKQDDVFCCGPAGSVYEIKFHILDDDTYLYVSMEDMNDLYSLTDHSLLENDDVVEPIEELVGFAKAKKSKYYDLYLEAEKFRDGLYDETDDEEDEENENA